MSDSNQFKLTDTRTEYLNLKIDTQQTGLKIINIQEFTSSGTYTATIGTKQIEVICIGGGGGGGGSLSGATYSIGGPGGAGGYIRAIGTIPDNAGATVTIGLGGNGNPGANGNNGNTTLFNWLGATGQVGATGGLGGTLLTNTPTLVNFISSGTCGGSYFTGFFSSIQRLQGSLNSFSSVYANGAYILMQTPNPFENGMIAPPTISNGPGIAAWTSFINNTGSGGAGSANTNNSGINLRGQSGANGKCIVIEYGL